MRKSAKSIVATQFSLFVCRSMHFILLHNTISYFRVVLLWFIITTCIYNARYSNCTSLCHHIPGSISMVGAAVCMRVVCKEIYPQHDEWLCMPCRLLILSSSAFSFLLTDIFGEAAGKIPAWTTNFPRIKKLYDPRGPTRREWDASALL